MSVLRNFSLVVALLLLPISGCGDDQAGNNTNNSSKPSQSTNANDQNSSNQNSGDHSVPGADQNSDQSDSSTAVDQNTDGDTDGEVIPLPPDPMEPDPEHTDTEPVIPPAKSAEDWARERIAGTVTSAAAFKAINNSGGFPVKTAKNTLIFMHWYEGGNWSLAGEFNNWVPQAMTNVGDVWYMEIPQPNASQNSYKFVNNGHYSADPFAKYYNFDENGEISLLTPPQNQAYHQRWSMVTGSQGLAERTIRAYIPGGIGPFPVIYAHDGQNLFGDGWKIEEALAKIQAQIIVVGIDNTNNRMAEYTHIDDTAFGVFYPSKGKQYAHFVNSTVRPMVEEALPTSDKRGVMGSSLGGLISLYIAHLFPGEYDMVLALSPTTAWGRFGNDDGTTIEDLYRQAGHKNTVLYLDNGGNEPQGGCGTLNQNAANLDESNNADDLDNYCFTRHFVNTMADEVGYTWEQDLYHWHEPGAKHNEAAWAARVFRPLEIFVNL